MDNSEVDNIDDIVDSVNLITRKSNKSGKLYKMLQVKLVNGYEYEVFVDRAVMFMFETLAKDRKPK